MRKLSPLSFPGFLIKAAITVLAGLLPLNAFTQTTASAARVIPADSLRQYEKDLKKLIPAYSVLRYERDFVFSINDAKDKQVGYLLLEQIDDQQRTTGYAGTVEVAVVIGIDGKVLGIVTGKNAESPGYMTRVKRALSAKWNGLELKDVPKHQVDALTGATLTSDAIIDGVKKLAADHLKSDSSPGKQ